MLSLSGLEFLEMIIGRSDGDSAAHDLPIESSNWKKEHIAAAGEQPEECVAHCSTVPFRYISLLR